MLKSAKAPRIALMTRDLDIFWSLHEARYLTIEAIEWFHFPHLTIEAIEWFHFPQWREQYVP